MRYLLLLMILGLVVGCGEEEKTDDTDTSGGGQPVAGKPDADGVPDKSDSPFLENGEPARVRIQHVLIAFKSAAGYKRGGSLKPQALKRTQAAAERLAKMVLSRAEGGFDFSSLVKTYTEDGINPADEIPGTYRLVNEGVTPAAGETARSGMVKSFSDACFSLKNVGDIVMCDYHETDSPYGWHIIKRLE